MTSSSKKKKRKRADFQKVKLKVGRKLPKGTNITNTSFKAKKIQIREQLRPEATEPSVKIRQNLNDILNNLSHHNLSSRIEATNKLKDLVATRPEIVFTKLSDVINRVGKLLEDKIRGVRNAALSVLKLILTQTNDRQILPMFPVLTGYLSCAMTHIDADIQSDSLSLLDALLDSFPKLLISSQNQILTNFLEQISHQRNTGTCQSSKANVSARTLSTNPDNKFSTQTWRLQVLLRLQKFLNAIYENLPNSQFTSPAKNIHHHHKWNGKRLYVMPSSELQDDCIKTDFLRVPTNSSKMEASAAIFQDYEHLQSFISSLMPLLFETWVESSPSQFIPNLPENCLPLGSAECLCCLMEILSCTQKIMESITEPEGQLPLVKWFQDTYQQEFLVRFMSHFPYTPHERGNVKKKKNKSEITMQVLCCNVNLTVCNVFTHLMPKVTRAKENLWFVIVHFLMKTFEHNELKPAAFDMKTAVEVLNVFLRDGRVKNVEEKLLEAVFSTYQKLPTGSYHQKHLIKLFSDLILEIHDSPVITGSKTLTQWVMSLPADFISRTEVPWEFVAVMQRVAARNNEAFLHSLQVRSTEIIDQLPKFKIVGCEPNVAQRAIIELLLWFKSLERNDYKKLSVFVQDKSTPEANRYYCIQILNARYLRDPMILWKTEAANYLSFLMTSLTGYLHQDLETLASTDNVADRFCSCSYSVVNVMVDSEKWIYHSRMMLEIKSCLQQFENLDQVKTVVCEYLLRLLTTFSTLPLPLVWSVFDLLESMTPVAEFILFDLANVLSDLAISTMIAEYKPNKCFSENTLRFLKIEGMLFERFLALIIQISQKLEDLEAVGYLCTVLTRVLQIKPLEQKHLSPIEEIAHHIEEKFGQAVDTVSSWSSLQYEFSLQKKALRLQSRSTGFIRRVNKH